MASNTKPDLTIPAWLITENSKPIHSAQGLWWELGHEREDKQLVPPTYDWQTANHFSGKWVLFVWKDDEWKVLVADTTEELQVRYVTFLLTGEHDGKEGVP